VAGDRRSGSRDDGRRRIPFRRQRTTVIHATVPTHGPVTALALGLFAGAAYAAGAATGFDVLWLAVPLAGYRIGRTVDGSGANGATLIGYLAGGIATGALAEATGATAGTPDSSRAFVILAIVLGVAVAVGAISVGRGRLSTMITEFLRHG
jgi:hypothetical protein